VRRISPTGAVFALLVLIGLAAPWLNLRPNRIVAGQGLALWDVLPVWSGLALAGLVLPLVIRRLTGFVRLLLAFAGIVGAILALGLAARAALPPDIPLARVSVAVGFWLVLAGFALALVDALARLRLSLPAQAGLMALGLGLCWAALSIDLLGAVSVMVEHAARAVQFQRALTQHLALSLGSVGLALLVGVPLGIALHLRAALRGPVLSGLNVVQTIPSLALFGLMIPVFGWIAASWPQAAAAGVSGIGPFPALVALTLYALLPVVANTQAGLSGVPDAVRDAARGMGMTRAQILTRIEAPLALPVLLTGLRIVLVQNIGLAVIAGLIGGGGLGTFVFQGLAQNAPDLILLGALPAIAMALLAGIGLDMASRALPERGAP
jgi:osmoprotectant transport system permease protein